MSETCLSETIGTGTTDTYNLYHVFFKSIQCDINTTYRRWTNHSNPGQLLFPAPQISKLFSSSKGWDGWTKEIKPHSMTCHAHFVCKRGFQSNLFLKDWIFCPSAESTISEYIVSQSVSSRINIYVYTTSLWIKTYQKSEWRYCIICI